MKGKTTLLALTAIVLVTGCNRSTTNNASANKAATANTAAPAAPAAAAGAPVDRAFLVGHWGLGGCANPTSYLEDGTWREAGTPDGRWELQGDTLTVQDPGDPAPSQVTVSRSGDNLVVAGPAGQIAFTRCAEPAAAPAGATAAPPAPADEAATDKGEDSN